MTRTSYRPTVLLGLSGVALMLTACGSSGSSSADSLSATSAPSTASTALQFSAVHRETQGSCPSRSATTIDDTEAKTCLHLGKPAMTVNSVQSAEATSEPQWSVIIQLGPDDAKRLKTLTTTVSKRPQPQNRLAVIAGSPSNGRLLSSPAVQTPIDGGGLSLTGGFTKKSATQLVHDLGH